MSRVGNFRPIPSKWITHRRSLQTQNPIGQQTGGGGGGGGGSVKGMSGGRTGSGKGKNKFKKIWSWQARAGWTIFSVLDWWLLAAGGWLTWRGVFLRWTPLGMCVAAAIQWHLQNKKLDANGLPRTAAAWQVSTLDFFESKFEHIFYFFFFFTDARLLLITTTINVTRLGLGGRSSCAHINTSHHLWFLLNSVWCEH
jgi:hypothetical protein